MKRFIFLLTLAVVGGGQLLAQKLSHFGQYHLMPHTLNPAFTGIEDYLDLKAGMRFSTLPTANTSLQPPSNYFVAANYSIHEGERGNPAMKALLISDPTLLAEIAEENNRPLGRHGIGLTFARREIGVYQNTLALLSYAYHQPLFGDWVGSLGVSGGLTQERLIGGDFIVIDGTDPIFIGLNNADGTQLGTLDLNAGLSIYNPNVYVAYAMNQLTSGTLNNTGVADSSLVSYITHTAQAGFQFKPSPNYQVQLSGVANVSPDLGLTYIGAAKMQYQELITLGLGYRSEGAVTGYLGLVLGAQLTVGYSYDYIYSDTRLAYTTGAHELILGYRMLNTFLKPTNFW